jgi:bidirectional [NiFe] hydrogenase diaphorase subunit
MLPYPATVPLPSADKRWKVVEASMRRHGYKPTALIEVLHTVQEAFGYLEDVSLRYVASSLRLPFSKVFGVATYYHFFNMKPPGEHTCVVCMGTGCYVKGAGDLMKTIEKIAGIGAGETTADGKVSVVAARCIGSCSLAPAIVFDGEVIPRAQAAGVEDRLRRWMSHDAR